MATPEYEPVAQHPEVPPEIQHHQEDIVIPKEIEQGIQAIPSHPASLQDDQGQFLAQSQSTTPPVQLPTDPKTLHTWASGSSDDSKTWLGVFWERVFKRAILYGKQVIVGNSSNA